MYAEHTYHLFEINRCVIRLRKIQCDIEESFTGLKGVEMNTAVVDYRSAKDNHDLSHIPGSFGLPIIGDTFKLVKDFNGTIDNQHKKYGPISRFALAGFKGVMVIGADHYQTVFLDRDKNFSTEMGYAGSLGRFYKGSLLLRDHDEHRYQRRMMQTAFKNDAMKGYMAQMAPIVDESLARWTDEDDFHFFPNIKQTLLDVAAKIFVGLEELNEDAAKLNKAFLDVAEGLMGIVTKELPGTKYKKGKEGERFLNSFFGALIDERRAGNGTDTFSYFTRELNEDGEYFSDEEIIRHMTFLLFAAHDTTTSALSHLMYHLGQDKALQQRLREEVNGIQKPHLEYEDLAKLPECEAAIKEALRMHPSVQLQQRRTIRECEIGGYTIPANTILFLAPSYLHRDPTVWDSPDTFDIDRWFEPRNEHKRHSFGFVGFGGGAHKCIGMHFALMNAKMFLHQFLTKFEFELGADSSHTFQTIPMPKPADDLPLLIRPLSV